MADTCRHAKCFCEPSGADFCGEQCAEAARSGHSGRTCECGHIDCEEATMREGGVRTSGGGGASM